LQTAEDALFVGPTPSQLDWPIVVITAGRAKPLAPPPVLIDELDATAIFSCRG
jgi:hypothetical protein